MKLSIIVCTYNRAASLAKTIDALHQQQVPNELEWEVVIVDNNSPDNTHQVVQQAQQQWPRLRYEFEENQGLSHARNHGIEHSSGEIILFTDDDVLPETDWVTTTLAGLERHQADACGGYIAPLWEKEPPHWLTERFYGFLAVRTDREDDYEITQANQAPFGANMGIRRNVLNTIGLFDTNRGRKGNVLASGEDGDMFERILKAGFKAVFIGNSRVHHKVEAFRVEKTYFRRWRYQTSRNLALVKGMPGERRIGGIPPYLFPQLLRAIGRWCVAKLFCPADEAFNREIIICHFLGTIKGLRESQQR